jgi:hypothetical protein
VNLAKIDISGNRLASLPGFLRDFPKLVEIVANDNAIRYVRFELFSKVPVIQLNRCPLLTSAYQKVINLGLTEESPTDVLTLKETAARCVARNLGTSQLPEGLPDGVIAYLRKQKKCDLCRATFFNHRVILLRFIYRPNCSPILPVFYYCCKRHFTDETSYLHYRFCTSKELPKHV